MRKLAGLAAAAVLGLPAAPAASVTTPTGAPCWALAFSPDFLRDRTAACVAQDYSRDGKWGRPLVHVTTDAGRTWTRQPASGLDSGDDYPSVATIAFSPAYSADRALFVLLRNGLYVSLDAGATFSGIDPAAISGGPDSLAPLPVRPGPNGDGVRTLGAFLFAPRTAVTAVGGPGPTWHLPPEAIIVPPAHVPVAGTLGPTDRFLVPQRWPDDPALALESFYTAPPLTRQHRLNRCTPGISCRDVIHEWLVDERVTAVELAADYTSKRVVYASVVGLDGRARVERSTDGGDTFRRWPAVDAVLAGTKPWRAELAVTPDNAKKLVLSVARDAASCSYGKRYAHELWVSLDAGATWRLRSYSRDTCARGPRGTLPLGTDWTEFTGLWQRGGRIYLIGAYGGDSQGIFCSVDDGKSWARNCKK